MKRRKYKRIALLLSAVLLVGAVDTATGPLVVEASSATQDKINKEEKEKEKLENQLDKAQENINTLEGIQDDLQTKLAYLNTERLTVMENLAGLEAQIAEKEEEIAETQRKLEEAKKTESWQQESIIIQMRCMYERKEESYLSMLLAADSFADLLNIAYYIERIMAYDQMKLDEFTENRIQIEAEEEKLKQEKQELEQLQAAAETERGRVVALMEQTQDTINQYSGQIEEAEKKALEYEKKIREKEESLEKLQEKLKEELARSLEALNAEWRDISELTFDEDDLYLLANLIYCEAGGEPYEGQVAVGSVVINRMLSSKFPDTLEGVIYQKRQFAPVASGRLDLALAVNKATPSCYKAAEEAMAGLTNVGNCLFFRTPIPGLEGIRIGGHIFY